MSQQTILVQMTGDSGSVLPIKNVFEFTEWDSILHAKFWMFEDKMLWSALSQEGWGHTPPQKHKYYSIIRM